jgi:hypothetical protein
MDYLNSKSPFSFKRGDGHGEHPGIVFRANKNADKASMSAK